ncbi:cobalamin B12-binding domain-containing protein [Bacillus sp. B1-b2]|nr:cobalamin B12-binding domain-containing protein [Bacillus sp. B1-b2]
MRGFIIRYQWEKEKMGNVQARKVMLFCPEAEHHTLGLKMCASTFEEYGWITRNLGANLPLEHALYMARKWNPDVIAISFTMSYTIPKLEQYISTFSDINNKPDIIIGSRLLNEYSFEMLKDNHIYLLNDQYSLKNWIIHYAKERALLNMMHGEQR